MGFLSELEDTELRIVQLSIPTINYHNLVL